MKKLLHDRVVSSCKLILPGYKKVFKRENSGFSSFQIIKYK